jgi:hypothetical protein
MLGMSGAGKTVVMQTIALRHAIDGAQVVLMEPADTCWRLRDAVGSDRACAYHSVAETPAINILDPVAGTPIDQRDSIVRKLEVALGKPQEHGGRIRVAPRPLSNREIGAIGRAMEHATLYGANCRELSGMTPTDAPLLHDLVDVLQAQDSAESRKLAAEIADTLLGTAAAIFNTRTTLHFDPAADVSLYSFRGVKPERLPLIYDYLFDTIDAYVWSAARDRTRPVLVFIDEFYYMASVASLEQRVVKASKTWRNRRAALWSADQNAETYFGAGGAAWGPFVTDNTRQKLFFQLEGGADVVANAYRHKLTPAHVDQLRMLRRGQCVAMLDRDVRLLNVELTPLEGRALL